MRFLWWAVRHWLRGHKKVARFRAHSVCVSLNRVARLCNDCEVHSIDSNEIYCLILPGMVEIVY